MKIDPNKFYLMPLIMGSISDQGKPPNGIYREVQYLSMQYQTDSDAIQVLLPDCYQPAEKLIVTAMFGYYDGVDFMAGRGYSIASLMVAARFDGEKDHIEGDYVLVMYEDDAFPITTGHELQGIHKVYADISPVKILPNGHLRCETSLWGHLLFSMDLEPLKEQNVLIRSIASKRINERPQLGYKYIPSLDGPPDASYPTIMRSDTKLEQLWLGKSGEIFFGNAGEEDIGFGKRVVDALKTLPIRQIIQTVRFRGSQVLRNDLCGRLR
jgi:acetoacetate decarboxylase